MAERLRRLEYIFQRRPIYFVTACTHERGPILNNANVHAQVVGFGDNGAEHGAWLGAYVLMPDHLHAFVVMDSTRIDLSTWIKSLKNAVSKTLRIQGVPSPHWRKGFFDHIVRARDSYSAKWHYVRDNPVRAGLVREWSEWPFIGEIFDLEFRHEPN